METKLATLQQLPSDQVHESQRLVSQNRFYAQFLLQRLKAVEVGELLEPVIDNHILCNTANGLKWVSIPAPPQYKEVSGVFFFF